MSIRIIKGLVSFSAVILWLVFFYPKLVLVVKSNLYNNKLCRKPVYYSIVNFDTRFGLTKEEAKAELIKAEDIWEIPVSRELFKYRDTNPDVIVNFVFDDRQETTVKLDTLKDGLSSKKNDIEIQKMSFDTMLSTYNTEVNTHKLNIDIYNQKRADYESMSAYYNSGRTEGINYGDLKKRKDELDNIFNNLKSSESYIKSLETKISESKESINSNITSLNLSISDFNTISASNGETFNEGEYVYDSGKRYISIYQFDTKEKLRRLFAHELGHALGLDHNNNTKSIMYYLNDSSNMIPTKEDILDINNICK